MPQYFHRRWSTLSRVVFYGAPVYVAALIGIAAMTSESPRVTGEGIPVDQPVPFSHAHHAGRLKIDCRYCHETVEHSAFAGMPSTDVCMHCHSEVWAGHPALEPVISSEQTNIPLAWRRVHDLTDLACFDHSIHVQKGIGCDTCHGRVDQMSLVWQAESLYMEWCLECHRAPEKYVRPREEVFNLAWRAPENPDEFERLAQQLQLDSAPRNARDLGVALVEKYDIQVYTSCSNCHH